MHGSHRLSSGSSQMLWTPFPYNTLPSSSTRVERSMSHPQLTFLRFARFWRARFTFLGLCSKDWIQILLRPKPSGRGISLPGLRHGLAKSFSLRLVLIDILVQTSYLFVLPTKSQNDIATYHGLYIFSMSPARLVYILCIYLMSQELILRIYINSLWVLCYAIDWASVIVRLWFVLYYARRSFSV